MIFEFYEVKDSKKYQKKPFYSTAVSQKELDVRNNAPGFLLCHIHSDGEVWIDMLYVMYVFDI